jgi:hypothetical protein
MKTVPESVTIPFEMANRMLTFFRTQQGEQRNFLEYVDGQAWISALADGMTIAQLNTGTPVETAR